MIWLELSRLLIDVWIAGTAFVLVFRLGFDLILCLKNMRPPGLDVWKEMKDAARWPVALYRRVTGLERKI